MRTYIFAIAAVIFLNTSTHAIEGTIKGIPWDGLCTDQACTNAFNYAKEGVYDKAREELFKVETILVSNVKKRKKLIGKDKNLAAIYYNLGVISELEEDYETATNWYERGTQARSKDLAKRFKLAPERISAQIIRKEAAERRAEKARLAAEKKAEKERLAAEQKVEAARLAAEKEAKAERLVAENKARAEMLAAEKKAQAAMLAAEKKAQAGMLAAERKAQAERLAAEKKAQTDRLAAKKAAEAEKIVSERKEKETKKIRQAIWESVVRTRYTAADLQAEKESETSFTYIDRHNRTLTEISGKVQDMARCSAAKGDLESDLESFSHIADLKNYYFVRVGNSPESKVAAIFNPSDKASLRMIGKGKNVVIKGLQLFGIEDELDPTHVLLFNPEIVHLAGKFAVDDMYAEKSALSQMEFSDKYGKELVELDGKANQVGVVSAVRGLGEEGIQKLKEFYGDDPWFYELEQAFYIELGGEIGTQPVNCIFSSHPMHGDKLKSIVKGAGVRVRGRYMETETDQILITHSEIVRAQ